MSSPPPTKPPRGVKQGKETSGLLMSVIRTLSASETNEQREKERAKLEKEYKKSDARLDELVAAHSQEITEVMQKFGAVQAAMGAWGQHCAAAEARLAACRALLRLRRADLRRLWADARAHHHALRMLTDIERVVVSEREARELAASGRVLAAAHALSAALLTARTQLPHVHALSATTHHLEAKKLELVEVVVRRLSEAVYRDERAPLSRRVSARRRTALLLAELTKSEEVTDAYLQDVTPEFEAALAEDDNTFETTVMVSLEALGVLEQLQQATEKFKVQIQNELLEVIDCVSRRIIDDVELDLEGDADGECEQDGTMPDLEGAGETGRPLARLVSSLAEEFRACGSRNKRLIQLWRAALQKHKISDTCLHTEQHYWSAVQQVMQLLLTEYLEIESVTLAAQRSRQAAEPPPDLPLADYFAKRRPQRRRNRLFKLSAPPGLETGVAGAGGGGGGGAGASGERRRPLVCRPHPALLHAALPALHALCAHLERNGGGECSLRAFISDYVRWGETERLAQSARSDVDTAMRAPSAWRERAPRSVGVSVFACVAEAWSAVERCAAAARRCGACGGGAALRATDAALGALAAHSRAAHARITPAPPARAARWLADDDIVRFLQTLPNYRAVVDGVEHTAQELKQAYEREAEILGTSLGDGEVTRREVVCDVTTLVDLALMCESMEWVSANIRTIPSLVSSPALKLPAKFASDMDAAASIFDEISHKCLLFLHLEMRIECFHYLGQEERGEAAAEGEADGTGGGGGAAGGGGGAARLAHALLAFHEQASAVLAPQRLAYIMSGLGEMMSSAVVWRWQWEGVAGAAARLATLRHALAALHAPADGLHTAHAYMQLLACTPEEIISMVRDKGPQFSELEYLNAFKVIGARRGMAPADMRAALRQLSAALGHVGVTV